jgi:hypothetical protein
MKIRIAATNGGAGFELRLRDLTPKAINLKLLQLRCFASRGGLRTNPAKATPFAQEVSADMQILDAYATLRALARARGC